MKMRLNKFLSESGVASRRKCDELIEAGRVKVNGKAAVLGMIIDGANDIVEVDRKQIKFEKRKKYFVLYKPRGVVSTASDEKGRKTVLDLVPSEGRIFPVGRLDRESSGVLLLTNDGDLAHRLTHPKFGVPKVYVVLLMKPISALDVKRVNAGIMLEDGLCTPDSIKIMNRERTRVEITLTEGRNREIRRLFEALGNRVRRLKRIRFGTITVKSMKPGQFRELTEAELKSLKKLINARKSNSA